MTTEPTRPPAVPDEPVEARCAPSPACRCRCHSPGGMAVSHVAPCCTPTPPVVEPERCRHEDREHPNWNHSWLPCQLDADHTEDHYASTGCAGGTRTWPKSPPVVESPDEEARLAEALTEHWFIVRGVKPGIRWVGCACGWEQAEDNRNQTRHNAHLASVLAAQVAERERRAAERVVAAVEAVCAQPDDEQEWELFDCETHDCEGCETPHLTKVQVVNALRVRAALAAAQPEGETQ